MLDWIAARLALLGFADSVISLLEITFRSVRGFRQLFFVPWLARGSLRERGAGASVF